MRNKDKLIEGILTQEGYANVSEAERKQIDHLRKIASGIFQLHNYNEIDPELLANAIFYYILNASNLYGKESVIHRPKVAYDRFINSNEAFLKLLEGVKPVLLALCRNAEKELIQEIKIESTTNRTNDIKLRKLQEFETKLVFEEYNKSTAGILFEVDRRTVYEWVKTNKLRFILKGKREIILKEEMLRFYKENVLGL
ncbi:MAG: hypothetical protein ACKOW9_03140 [Candidatus Paceibacterota bacterium]